ncbi:MAG: sugar phosphate isomerase/epimerase [Clostridiales bacterium]|nr:sugar phosphate isomerase/epimerase [Clostridiales bacterium]
MKKGISIWAFTEPSLEKCFAMAKKYGYDGVELALAETGDVNLNSTKEDMEEIKSLAQKYDLELFSVATGLYWSYSLTANDEAVRQKAEDIVRKQVDVASWLGCDTILVIPGMVSGLSPGGEVVPYDVVYDRALAAIKRLAPYAEERKVVIGLENVWNKFLLSPTEMRDFIDEVNNPYVGAYFDVGNVIINGYPEQWISILGSRIAKVHFKDYRRNVGTLDGFVDILSGDVDYPAVMEALSDIGYDDWATAEVFPQGKYPESVLAVTSKAVDIILGR